MLSSFLRRASRASVEQSSRIKQISPHDVQNRVHNCGLNSISKSCTRQLSLNRSSLYIPNLYEYYKSEFADTSCTGSSGKVLGNILLLCSYVPEFNGTAAGVRTRSQIWNLQSLGYHVIMGITGKIHQNNIFYCDEYSKMGVPLIRVASNDEGFDTYIQSQYNKDIPQKAVVFDRFNIEEQFGWRVMQHAPNTLRILDTQDLHTLRVSRQERSLIEQNVDVSTEFENSNTEVRELSSIHRSDIVLMISRVETNQLEDLGVVGDKLSKMTVQTKKIWNYPLVNKTETSFKTRSFDKRAHLVTIGTWRHAPNEDSVQYQRDRVYPKIRELFLQQNLPPPELHVYGSHAHAKHMSLHAPEEGLYIMGMAKEVQSTLRNYKVLVAPQRFGAGVKGKVLDAFRSGTPVVGSSVAAEDQYNENGQFGGFVVDDVDVFAQKVLELYQQQEVWEDKVRIGEEQIQTDFSLEKGERVLQSIFRYWEDAEVRRKQDFTGRVFQQQQISATYWMSRYMESKRRKE